jgi:hypothetical protein
MSGESLARSHIWAGPLNEAEYDDVCAAIMATERGRWFLTEYASRNRNTHAVLGALARVEAALRNSQTAQAPAQAVDIAAVAERIQDIAFTLRERSADAALCDALDAAVREIAGGCRNGSKLPVVNTVEPATAATGQQIEDDATFARNGLFTMGAQETSKFTEAVATLADASHSPAEEPVTSAEPKSDHSDAVLAALDDANDRETASTNGSDESPRWRIEAPDFAFHRVAPEEPEPQPADASAENGYTHALLPHAQLLPGPQDDPADLFESPAGAPAMAAAPVTAAPAAITPAAIAPALMRPAPQPDPLAGLRALSEEEVIALFS